MRKIQEWEKTILICYLIIVFIILISIWIATNILEFFFVVSLFTIGILIYGLINSKLSCNKCQNIRFKFPVTYIAKVQTSKGKKYTLPVECIVTMCPETKYNNFPNIKQFYLTKLFFPNGGCVSFENTKKTKQTVSFDKSTVCISKDGEKYDIQLQDRKIDEYDNNIILQKIKNDEVFLKKLKEKTITDIKNLIQTSSNNYKYYANLFSDYSEFLNQQYADYFKTKKHPAPTAADEIKELSKKIKHLEFEYKSLNYQMEIYENIFPWLTDFSILTTSDIQNFSNSQVYNNSESSILSKWLSKNEYEKLSNIEKYQLALDRYKKSHKSNWEIGIAYERYIGYTYETKGYKTTYYGATKGLNDLGRDLIAENKDEIIVIQCKYWSKDKTIHEKHIFQLYGTMFAMSIDKPNKVIKGLFVTSASLSDTAKIYAEKLNVAIQEHSALNLDYPCIKCNISKNTGEKIYHLPFDQQYDNIDISSEKGELYVSTVKEAETLGFRRANKWHGN